MPLTNSPLTAHNAHDFIPNQPNRLHNCSLYQFNEIKNLLLNTNTGTFHTFYFHPFNSDLDKQALNNINESATKRILVSGVDYPFYHCTYQPRGSYKVDVGGNIVHVSNPDVIFGIFVAQHFNDSKKSWGVDLKTLWDRREFMAINFKPIEIVPKFNDPGCYTIDALDLWTNLDIKKLFDYLEIKIDDTRVEQWKVIYQQWTNLHASRIKFFQNFDRIITGILENQDIDLLEFNLDIRQESVIQRTLIEKHNLNLKIWQLERFTNTSQLHSLLEPSTITISSE